MQLGLYVHLPFCPQRCSYCDFPSLGPCRPQVREAYLQALQQEMFLAREKLSEVLPGRAPGVASVYLGGGTPTFLSADQLVRVLDAVRHHLPVTADAEVTVEANPGTVDRAKLRVLRQAGVNRISLGIQAWQDRHLRAMGRKHTVAHSLAAWEAARDAGFTNINLDLLYSFPGQTLGDWKQSLARTVALGPEHISCYGLELHSSTRWGWLAAHGRLALPDEKLWSEMFGFVGDFLAASGYEHYEIANYARSGKQSRHNQIYWRRRPYLGLGLAAASCIGRWRWKNATRLRDYLADVARGKLPVAEAEELDLPQVLGEALMLHLRLRRGADLEELGRRYGLRPEVYFGPQIQKLVAQGLIEKKARHIRLAPRALPVANLVFREFV